MSPAAERSWVLASGVSAGDEWVTTVRANLRQALTELRDLEGFEMLSFMTAVDHLATPASAEGPLFAPPGGAARFELVYELRSYAHRKVLRLRVFVPEDDPKAPSIHDIYANANWDERETWDMFGIAFEGHPELTRILNPDDWVGHPLRRDYPVGGEQVDFSEDHEVWETAPERG